MEENKKSHAGKHSSERLKPHTHTEKVRPKTDFSVWSKINSLPEARKQKVLDLRQQLKEKTYDLDKHLDVSLNKLLNELRK